MWKVVSAVVLSIFLTCTMFLLVYGMAYVVVYKTIDWTQKIVRKLREPSAEEKEKLRKERERELFGRPSDRSSQIRSHYD
tara:strand:- start:423 stop:662 length:240 start_codon:yes stop_codon:yes gene_type:complete